MFRSRSAIAEQHDQPNRKLFSDDACLDHTNLLNVFINGCDFHSVLEGIQTVLPETCSHSAMMELQLLTGSTNGVDDAEEYVSEMCWNAWNMVDTTTFETIQTSFNDEFMNEYAD